MSKYKKRDSNASILRGAIIFAIIGALLFGYFIHRANDKNYDKAPVFDSSSAGELGNFSGKVVIDGNFTANGMSVANLSGEYCYMECWYEDRKIETDKDGHTREYWETEHIETEWGENAEICGIPINTDNTEVHNKEIFDTGSLSYTKRVEYIGVKGTEVPAVLLCKLEKGVMKNGDLYPNFSVSEALEYNRSVKWFPVIGLIIWELACAFAVVSMLIQGKE